MSLIISIINAQFHYGLVSSSVERMGMVVNAVTGSPQLSLEPVTSDPTEVFPGDMWVRSGSMGLMIGESGEDGTTYKSKVLTIRPGDSTATAISRMSTLAVSSSILTANTLIVDDWLISVNSPGISGSGWQNQPWGGGIHMPDSNTVGVWSDVGKSHNFLVPSGSVITNAITLLGTGSILVPSGNLAVSGQVTTTQMVVSGNIILSGSSSELILTGSNASAFLRGRPILSVLTGSLSSGSISIPDNNIYVRTTTNPPEISLRISGSWINFTNTTQSVYDGGTF